MDMTPQKLADWLQDKTIYLWDSGDEQYYASPICEDIVPMLRQQQAEIGCYKLELELHKAMIQDLEKVIKIKERDYNFMKDLAIGTEELLRKAQEK